MQGPLSFLPYVRSQRIPILLDPSFFKGFTLTNLGALFADEFLKRELAGKRLNNAPSNAVL